MDIGITLKILMFAGALWGVISCAGAQNYRAAIWAACTAVASVHIIILSLS